ncbi:MAG: hypothetical protein K8F91_08915, partial [Candidatus Obscuribacterales bacterium]|nr:hypothetical protein [Candidatus Obscuribacterales bacterium]
MTTKPVSRFSISSLEPDAFSLHSVVAGPRSASPTDLKNASANVKIESLDDYLPSHCASFLDYLFKTFFPLAHRTGLYNRQEKLWESIARVDHGQVEAVSSGWLFNVKKEPACDLILFDRSDRPLILARLIDPEFFAILDEKVAGNFLTSFLKRVTHLKTTRGSLTGSFFCLSEPLKDLILKRIEQLVEA